MHHGDIGNHSNPCSIKQSRIMRSDQNIYHSLSPQGLQHINQKMRTGGVEATIYLFDHKQTVGFTGEQCRHDGKIA